MNDRENGIKDLVYICILTAEVGSTLVVWNLPLLSGSYMGHEWQSGKPSSELQL